MSAPTATPLAALYQPETEAVGIAYVKGTYVPLAQASIPMTDRGFVRSDATYDVVHVWKGCFFRLDDHVDRFWQSMAGLRMGISETKDEVKAILSECVRRSGLRDAYVQMTCTRGVPPKSTRDPRACTNQFSAFAQPFVWIANEEQRQAGLSMVISKVQRIPPEAIDPRIKNFHWLDLTMALLEAYDRGAEIPLLPDANGNVTEGPGYNVFALIDGRLATPARGMFEGLTRRTVLDLAEELQIPVDVRDVPADAVRKAHEVFITSTAGGIMPVKSVDGHPIGGGAPGRVTGALRDLYWRRHAEGWMSTPVDYEANPSKIGGTG